ncbi:MAG TPA: acyl-CoA-binding protein [Polyangiaceae bacterium]|nr:acyl-CoA-binding protein [Polyangiaceae bacterium]
MALEDDFKTAQNEAQSFTARPSTTELLELYSLFKQATLGDAQGTRPGIFDLKGRAKYDAWSARRGTSKEAAMARYVALVAELGGRYGRAAGSQDSR